MTFLARMRGRPQERADPPASLGPVTSGQGQGEARKTLADLARLRLRGRTGAGAISSSWRDLGRAGSGAAWIGRSRGGSWTVWSGWSGSRITSARAWPSCGWPTCTERQFSKRSAVATSGFPTRGPKSLTMSLLNRAEAVGEQWGNTLVQLTMRFAASNVVAKPKLSFEDPNPGQTMVGLSVDSLGGKLWSCLVGWAGPEGSRRAAYGRAVRDIWLYADELARPNGPDQIQCSGLMLSLRVDALSTIHPEIAAPAILSANWSYRPLSAIVASNKDPVSLESTFQEGARVYSRPTRPSAAVGDSFTLAFRSLRDGHGNQVVVPPEAVLLRMRSAEGFASFARRLAWLHGRHDGRAFELLNRLSLDHENPELRREYARLAVAAPWRLVRDSPSVVRTWGWHQRSGLGGVVSRLDLATLRSVLSEPEVMLDDSDTLWDTLMKRNSTGGIWEHRDDGIDLGLQACEVPGLLPALMVSTRLAMEKHIYAGEVQAALDQLAHPEDHPASRLAAEIFFLRIAAERRPYVSLDQGEIDLRESLPARLVTVLRSVMTPAASQRTQLRAHRSGAAPSVRYRRTGTRVPAPSTHQRVALADLSPLPVALRPARCDGPWCSSGWACVARQHLPGAQPALTRSQRSPQPVPLRRGALRPPAGNRTLRNHIYGGASCSHPEEAGRCEAAPQGRHFHRELEDLLIQLATRPLLRRGARPSLAGRQALLPGLVRLPARFRTWRLQALLTGSTQARSCESTKSRRQRWILDSARPALRIRNGSLSGRWHPG